MRYSIFPQDSRLYFTAVERDDYWRDRHGKFHKDPTLKKILRNTDKGAHVLATVGYGWKLIQNKELFQTVEQYLLNAFPREQFEGLTVRDEMAYHGALCIRQYIFPSIRRKITDKSELGFRVIVINGFGKSSVRVICGAIDYYCSNGMIMGAKDVKYFRHTKGLQIESIVDVVRAGAEKFAADAERYTVYARTKTSIDNVEKFLKTQNLSQRRIDSFLAQVLQEFSTHGQNIWAVFSALTYYASHNSTRFPIRKTDNDNEAAVLLKRQEEVRAMVNSNQLKELVA